MWENISLNFLPIQKVQYQCQETRGKWFVLGDGLHIRIICMPARMDLLAILHRAMSKFLVFQPVTITGQTDRPAENCSAAFREIHQKLIEEAEKKAEGYVMMAL